MATSSKTDSEASQSSNPPPAANAPPEVAQRASVLGPTRLAAMTLAAKIDAAKLRTLKLERARLAALYGDSDERVALVEQAFDARVADSPSVSEFETARLPPVPADPETFVMHGRVIDEQGAGLRGATVCVSDVNDRSNRSVGTAKSDEGGYYKLVIAPLVIASKPKTEKRSASGTSAPAPGSRLRVRVLYGDKCSAQEPRIEPVELVKGRVLVLDLPVETHATGAS